MIWWIDMQFRKLARNLKRFTKNDNSGMGVIEIILIIVVLISLVVIFRTQMTALVKSIFEKINNQALNV